MNVDFEKTPLVPAVVQDAHTGEVRMLGYMDRAALDATRATGELHLHSRSRGKLWKKGETSGNIHKVVGVSIDCDGDAILVTVVPLGPTCHAGTESCFEGPPPTIARLERVIRSRIAERPGGSYTADLAAKGTASVAQKVGEEAVETVIASLGADPGRLVSESADLLYHLLLLLAVKDVRLADVLDELDRRAAKAKE